MSGGLAGATKHILPAVFNADMTPTGPAGDGLRRRLADARLYLCTDARRDRGDLVEFLDAVLPAGVDVVQLREKGLEARQELALLETMADACRRHGRLLAVNDRADVALGAGADILHLGQDDLPTSLARQIVGSGPLVGRSSHSLRQAEAAATDPAVDYFCAGPIWQTPTKPGRLGTGLSLIEQVSAMRPQRPWFAIGGIDLARLDDVIAAGARRVVVVRALTDADDPAAAAHTFAEHLRAVPLDGHPDAGRDPLRPASSPPDAEVDESIDVGY